MALSAHAAVPPGWIKSGDAANDYDFAVDPSTGGSGRHSASIIAKPGATSDGFATLMQLFAADDYRGARWRLSGYLRTESANRAQMWMRVDGPNKKALSFDNMDSHPVTGTTGWTRYEIVLDAPSDSVDIAFGFLLKGSGKVWGNGFKLEKVDADVPVTFAGPPLPRAPVNLDFEESASTQAADRAPDHTQPPGPSTLEQSSPSAVWTTRKLHGFGVPDISSSTAGIGPDARGRLSCDGLVAELRALLLQLGARASDLRIDERDCRREVTLVDATFSVLASPDKAAKPAADPLIGAHWKLVEVRTGMREPDGPYVNRLNTQRLDRSCHYLEYVTKTVLPLFSSRDVKRISRDICNRTGVGLRAQVVMPDSQPTINQPIAVETPMRTRLMLSVAAASLVSSAPLVAANSNQSAVWEPRTLRNFTLPLVVDSENGPLQMASCDQIYTEAKILLLQLGARASDIRADLRGCYAYTIDRSIDLSFSVLVPATQATKNAAGPSVQAHWRPVLLKGNCRLLEDATKKIVPLFTTLNVKLISSADCAKLGVGFYGQVLSAPEQQASSP